MNSSDRYTLQPVDYPMALATCKRHKTTPEDYIRKTEFLRLNRKAAYSPKTLKFRNFRITRVIRWQKRRRSLGDSNPQHTTCVQPANDRRVPMNRIHRVTIGALTISLG